MLCCSCWKQDETQEQRSWRFCNKAQGKVAGSTLLAALGVRLVLRGFE